MKIFIGTSFTSKVLPDGTVEPAFRTQIERIIESLESKGHNVYCGVREDNWRLNDVEPGQAFLNDADAVKTSDLIIMLIKNNPVSAGMQFELGIAYALEKRIVMLWQEDDLPIPYMNQGLLENKLCTGHSYKSLDDTPKLLETLIN